MFCLNVVVRLKKALKHYFVLLCPKQTPKSKDSSWLLAMGRRRRNRGHRLSLQFFSVYLPTFLSLSQWHIGNRFSERLMRQAKEADWCEDEGQTALLRTMSSFRQGPLEADLLSDVPT